MDFGSLEPAAKIDKMIPWITLNTNNPIFPAGKSVILASWIQISSIHCCLPWNPTSVMPKLYLLPHNWFLWLSKTFPKISYFQIFPDISEYFSTIPGESQYMNFSPRVHSVQSLREAPSAVAPELCWLLSCLDCPGHLGFDDFDGLEHP